MASKKQFVSPSPLPPRTLTDHPFFGLQLDEDQISLRDAIWDPKYLIVFCNAAAGTGKTLVAAATAELLIQYGRYQNIVYLMSPYAESKQGYLPGTLFEKSQYYNKPFFQALVAIGVNPISAVCDDTLQTQKSGCGYISCGTDSFIRGVNYDEAVVILDEAQNFTTSQLRTALSRCSDRCKVIVVGSTRQIDIERPDQSGFAYCIEHFSNQPWAAICHLTHNHRGILSTHADSLVSRQ